MPAGSSAPRPAGRPGERLAAAGVSLATLAAVLAPVVQNWRRAPSDGFPLSYYPMFSARRGRRARFTYLVGYDAAGAPRFLPHTLVGAGGLNQVRRQLGQIARGDGAEALCGRVAAELARRPGPHADIVRVQFVASDWCLKSYCRGERKLLRERVLAEAAVGRAALPAAAPAAAVPVAKAIVVEGPRTPAVAPNGEGG